jgi:hypothetical protein
MLRPVGKPVALHVRGRLPASLAEKARETLAPSTLLWFAMLPRLTNGLTLQTNAALPLPVASAAVSTTSKGPSAAAPGLSVPVTRPVGVRLRPSGSPVALHARTWPKPEAPSSCRETTFPSRLLWFPGLFRPTSPTCKKKAALTVCVPSLRVTPTGNVPSAEGVPLITPALLFSVSPVGSPVALKVTAPPSAARPWSARERGRPSTAFCNPRLGRPSADTLHARLWLTVSVPSLTATVTANGVPLTALVEIVPLMTPKLALMLSPVGKPVALNASVPLTESLVLRARETESPPTLN